jgi:hypothetical protein
VNPRHTANLCIRIARRVPVAAALACCASGCRSPLGGRELDLAFSAQALPGAGAGLALAQRMLDHGTRRLDFELGLERQELAEAGPDGDDWTRIFAGLRSAAGEPGSQLQGRAGVTWLRSEGDATGLEAPGDYGGMYLGGGWSFEAAPALAMGPDLTLLFLDSEGDRSGSGVVAELAWRFVWHL